MKKHIGYVLRAKTKYELEEEKTDQLGAAKGILFSTSCVLALILLSLVIF